MTRRPRGATVVRLVPLGGGLALLVYLVTRLGLYTIVGMLGQLRWSVLAVVALYAGHQTARAAALMWSVRGGRALRLAEALWIRLSGEAVEFLTFTGPLMAEPTKAWLLQRAELKMAEGLAATLTEYVASMVAAAVTAIVGVSYVLAVVHPVGPARIASRIVLVSASVFVALIAAGAAARVRIVGRLVHALTRRPTPTLDAIEDAMTRTAHETPGRLMAILSCEFAAQACLGLELWSLLAALRLPASVGRAAVIEGLMKVMNAGAMFVPGQVGVAEGTYALVFGMFALPAAAGVTISLVRHLRSLLTALVGFVALVSLRAANGGDLFVEARPHVC